MKNISLVIVITLIFIFIINLLIVVVWPIYSKINANKHEYISEQIELLGLSETDLVILHNETWKNYDKFRFIPYLGHSETERKGKFVNFTEKNGRKVVRPKQCKENYYLYGGSTTFGYNVTDDQTIGQYLQNLLNDDGCVYNHGRAYYYSKQENNLFINHIENGRQIDHAIFLDGVNERCGGYEYSSHLNSSFNALVERPFLMWKNSLKNFIFTLPIAQFTNSLFGKNRWIQDDDNNILKIENCSENFNLERLYQTRLNVRKGICEINNIKCYSFFQPMAPIHGVQIPKLLTKSKWDQLVEKFNKLSKVDDHIELGYILNNDKTLSYIDAVHYSPSSNKKIASEIFKYLN